MHKDALQAIDENNETLEDTVERAGELAGSGLNEKLRGKEKQ